MIQLLFDFYYLFFSELEDDQTSLAVFDAGIIYRAVLHCVEAIKMKNCDLPRKLPPGMSQRFRAGSSLASMVTVSGLLKHYWNRFYGYNDGFIKMAE